MVGERLSRLLSGVGRRGAAAARPASSAATAPGTREADPRAERPGADGDPASPAEGQAARAEVDAEEAERLVRLTFVALLRREPDRDTLLAYRDGFANGSTFQDLIADVLSSEEYATVRRREAQRRTAAASAAAEGGDRGVADDMRAAMAALATRLAEKGCRPRLGEAAPADRDADPKDPARLARLLATLSMVDRL